MAISDLYQKQYEMVRGSIANNIITIKQLVVDVKRLIMTIANVKELEESVKKELLNSIKAIHETINTLIDQTIEIFEQFESFSDTMSAAVSY